MREIKFRGNSFDLKQIYGYLLVDNNKTYYIVNYNNGFRKKIEVISCTIGQFTGLFDKFKNEIYEGDILEVEWSCGLKENAIVIYDEECCEFATSTSSDKTITNLSFFTTNLKVKVIGCIHEILKNN